MPAQSSGGCQAPEFSCATTRTKFIHFAVFRIFADLLAAKKNSSEGSHLPLAGSRGWAAVGWADIMVGTKPAHALTWSAVESFLDQFANHEDELRMAAGRTSSHHSQSVFDAEAASFVVEVVQNFHVIRQKADR